MRSNSPNAIFTRGNISVKAADIQPDGAVVQLPFSWAGPETTETLGRVLEDAVAIAAVGIVPNLGSGRAGALIALDQLLSGEATIANTVPVRSFDLGSVPLGEPAG